jgi:putative addiction module component (TIGR02574 family)
MAWYYDKGIKSHKGGCMSSTLKSFGIDQLTVAQRILLAEEIWDSIPDEPDAVPLTDTQRKDLERRLAAYEANPQGGSSWEKGQSAAGS